MSDKTRALLGLMLIIISLFYDKIPDLIPKPGPGPDAPIIDINEPSQEIISVTRPIADLVTDENDRLKLCCFNKVFADRVGGYLGIKAQQANDLYVQAAKNYFSTTLQEKYDGLSEGLTSLFKREIDTQEHTLSDEERSKLSKTFLGLAWCLNN